MDEAIKAWQEYVDSHGWESLTKGVKPTPTPCGLVYELGNPLNRTNEDFAIGDLRNTEMTEPHKHINGETEIYFVIQGEGRMSVGDAIHELRVGDAVVTPPETVHIATGDNLILGLINTPPFNPNNYVAVSANDPKIAATIKELGRG